ncbi:MAG: hypothetical protein JWO05_2039 [Gemmatimonadetes bacterium]|nr:hypothetical protein [Gemmatimonadota bacterium]
MRRGARDALRIARSLSRSLSLSLSLCAWSAAAGQGTDSLKAAITAAPAAAPTAPRAIRVDPARLRAGRALYRVTLVRGDSTDTLGTHSTSQQAVDYAGRRAWLMLEQRGGRATSLDSLVMDSTSGRALHWGGVAPLSHLALELSLDTLYGVIASSQGRVTVKAGVPAGAVLGGAWLALALQQAPLSPSYADSTDLVVADVAGVTVLAASAMVEREETVGTLAGPFDCWVVRLSGSFGDVRLWVAKDGRALVRREQSLARMNAVLVEELVVLDGAAP